MNARVEMDGEDPSLEVLQLLPAGTLLVNRETDQVFGFWDGQELHRGRVRGIWGGDSIIEDPTTTPPEDGQ